MICQFSIKSSFRTNEQTWLTDWPMCTYVDNNEKGIQSVLIFFVGWVNKFAFQMILSKSYFADYEESFSNKKICLHVNQNCKYFSGLNLE